MSAPGSLRLDSQRLRTGRLPRRHLLPRAKSSRYSQAGGSPEAAIHASRCRAPVSVLFGLYQAASQTAAAAEGCGKWECEACCHVRFHRPEDRRGNALATQRIDSRPRFARDSRAAAGNIVCVLPKADVLLGDRSMVGQCPLEAFIQVRIQIAQPVFVPGNGAKANQLGGTSGMDDSNVDGDIGRRETAGHRRPNRASSRPRRTGGKERAAGESKRKAGQAGAGAQASRNLAEDRRFKLFSGTANRPLAEAIGGHIGVAGRRHQVAALRRWRGLLPTARERSRRRCICGAAHLLSGGPAPGGAAGDD